MLARRSSSGGPCRSWRAGAWARCATSCRWRSRRRSCWGTQGGGWCHIAAPTRTPGPAALGHARVVELLQDARLRDVCWLELIGNGQALVRSVLPQACASPFASMAPPPLGQHCWSTCASTRQPCSAALVGAVWPMSASRGHAPPSFSTHVVWSLMQAVPAVDVSSGLSDGSTELATSASAMDCESSSVVDQRPGSLRSDLDLEQCLAGTGEELQGAGLSPAFKSCGFVVRNTFIDTALEREVGASRRGRSVPREMHFAMHE
mmetsp:Transcript_47438/g.110168  ORF Transcript_47438/g.110168 Transcript_47438/m.110168 type:complete len:262 (+) Transcript_47438:185-970(+)